MKSLYPLSEFLKEIDKTVDFGEIDYTYSGKSLQHKIIIELPRTTLAKRVSYGLIEQLKKEPKAEVEGKMYGVLIAEDRFQSLFVLKAFSGEMFGQSEIAGWVPPIPGREKVELIERKTLQTLEDMKQRLNQLADDPVYQEYEVLKKTLEEQYIELKTKHKRRKKERKERRKELEGVETSTGLEEISFELKQLKEQSKDDSYQARNVRREHDSILEPLQSKVEQFDIEYDKLRKERKAVSRKLQTQMHAVYSLSNFAGQEKTLAELMPGGKIPTGTGDCCAPKLLHFAAVNQLKPITMAEFWWGPSVPDKREAGEFYGACVERCQPIMGYLLSGMETGSLLEPAQDLSLEVLFEDEYLIAINKPAGLLSVPGRFLADQDCVQSRARNLYPNADGWKTVHRLDMSTSGILLVAKDSKTHRLMSMLFQEREIEKLYEALLAGLIEQKEGSVDLPLAAIPERSPKQGVDFVIGKPSRTKYKVIEEQKELTRIQFSPITGRRHQLRVHSAALQGLNCPILGDRLYAPPKKQAERLYLHAKRICFIHPRTEEEIVIKSKVPF